MQPQTSYRPYPQQVPQRSPHLNSRRGQPVGMGPMMNAGPGPHHNMPMNPVQMAQAQAHANEVARRRSRKPTDKTLPAGVEDCIIGDGAQRYKELRDFERRLDATMTRKRLDIVDSVTRSVKRYKVLRIWISNTVEDQMWQSGGLTTDTFDFASNLESSYRVKIEGRLLDDDDEPDNEVIDGLKNPDRTDEDNAQKTGTKASSPRLRFSHFFKALSIDFEKTQSQSGMEQGVEWKKPDRTQPSPNLPPAAEFDEFTFKRNGDENMNITINLYRHEDPERFLLSDALADLVDMHEATRADIVMSIWEYIKLNRLQEDEEKRHFRCDELLKKVIMQESGHIPLLNDYIVSHLKPLPPIKLPYTIRVDEEFHKSPEPTIYDVRVAVDDHLKTKLAPFVTNPAYAGMLKDVASMDENLATVMQAIASSRAKHAFFTSLADDPAGFVRTWLASQKRDLEVVMGEASRGGGEDAAGDEWRRGGRASVWDTQNARESVTVLLAKPAAPGPR